ncbi:MAG: DUF4386 domain-containing protein [Algoriphagus sp.]|uniref:DUF4386 domain-containing protein n=1 Tax=Algoriphagus sp. TaxID=1872435 RepID=UPI0017DD263F|nr:DUF4386 domain-containing protein [Algoriphagus sp.]NVJ86667.1 DUF4386 domain-containing protein [Algoriphagus sp.]
MNPPKRKFAVLAGLSLILMAVLAGFAYGFVYSSLVFPEEAKRTLAAIQTSLGTFKAGIAAWVGILLLDILAAWALYKFLKEILQPLSFVTAAIRIFYSGILGVAIYHLFAVVPLSISDPSGILVLQELNAFESIWSAGLILFGFHLVGLGILCWKADSIPNFWGVLLIFAGICYTGVHLAKALFPDDQAQILQIEQILSLPMALAEIGLAVWLLWKGGKNSIKTQST